MVLQQTTVLEAGGMVPRSCRRSGCHIRASTTGGSTSLFFFNKFIYFICLLLAAFGSLLLCAAFSSCGKQGLLFIAVHGLLIAVASLVAENGL